jgi:hypothetical protein
MCVHSVSYLGTTHKHFKFIESDRYTDKVVIKSDILILINKMYLFFFFFLLNPFPFIQNYLPLISMTLPDLFTHQNTNNPIRFSLISCVTEDSIDSAAIATPLDASPQPPPSNTFSIINIVNDDPLPNLRAYPAIASTYTVRNRRAQTSPRPVPSSIFISTNIPQEHPIMIYDNNNTMDASTEDSATTTTGSSFTAKKRKFWPRVKRMMMSSNSSTAAKNNSSNNNNSTEKMEQLFESMNISANTNSEKLDSTTKLQAQKSNKRWLGRNRARVGPQR